ncbi:MAG: toll/interleukin-1 receptor domain-containing protein [Acidobacteria bacterium]|nr:toll/interleukin-1 receptor domain-containing protein [Acidobacteriota bacterium]
MSKPRIFISHSARNDDETMTLLDSVSAALADDFAVHVDKDHLKAGDDWRHTLNTWIGGCDAAVLLLSPKALKSDFVAYEISILAFRAKLSGIKVIPVFLKGVDEEAVRSGRLEPANLPATQGVKEEDTQKIIARLKEVLAEVVRSKTPVDEQAAYLETYFAPFLNALLTDCLRDTGFDLGSWEPPGNPRLSLAVRMMTLGLRRAEAPLRRMRAVLNREKTMDAVFELVATSWVDLRAAARLCELATGENERRALAVNASQQLIARTYVLRAARLPAEDSWRVVEVNGVFGGQTVAEIVAELKGRIEAALAQVFNLKPGRTVHDALASYDRRSEPVFVLLPAEGMSCEVVSGLRGAFRTVTFFFLAGNDAANRSLLSGMSVEYLAPELSKGFADAFCNQYEDTKDYLWT